MCTVGGRIGWIGTRSGTARRPGIAGPTTLGPGKLLAHVLNLQKERVPRKDIVFHSVETDP